MIMIHPFSLDFLSLSLNMLFVSFHPEKKQVVMDLMKFRHHLEVVCEPPISPDNGYIQGGSTYKAGEVVQFHCHRGYMVEGQPIAVCQDNGKWSGTFPKCKHQQQQQ